MTILITGGAGYIGSNMAYLLSDVGERSVILDTLETGFIEAIPKDIPFYQGCAGDQNLVKRIVSDHEIQEVIHFAGHTIVPESVENPIKYYKNNTINTINLLSACQESGVQKVVFSSTAAVYGNVSDGVRSETYPCEPATPYGRSKLMSEQVFADLASAWPEFRYIALRYFNVAGADPSLRTGQSTKNATHLIKVACEAALGIRDTFHLYGNDYATPDGTCIRDFVHVSDLVAAHYKALEYLRANGASRVLNCGYGRGYSVQEVLQTVAAVAEKSINVVVSGRRKGDLPNVVSDNRQIVETLNWMPVHNDLEQIVSHALAWEKQQSDRTRVNR